MLHHVACTLKDGCPDQDRFKRDHWWNPAQTWPRGGALVGCFPKSHCVRRLLTPWPNMPKKKKLKVKGQSCICHPPFAQFSGLGTEWSAVGCSNALRNLQVAPIQRPSHEVGLVWWWYEGPRGQVSWMHPQRTTIADCPDNCEPWILGICSSAVCISCFPAWLLLTNGITHTHTHIHSTTNTF